MPAKSESQQRLMGMALSAKRGKGHFGGKAKEVADSMTEKQLHDFAATKHKGLPEKRAQIELIKWAMGNAPQLALPGGGADAGVPQDSQPPQSMPSRANDYLTKVMGSYNPKSRWAMGNAPQLALPRGGGMVPNARPYYGPTSGPGVVNMGQAASRLGTAAKFIGGKVLPGIGSAVQAAGAYDRFKNKDYLGAALDGLGAAGSAGSIIPGWGLIGTGVSLGTTALNAYRDNRRAKQMAQQANNPQQPLNPEAANDLQRKKLGLPQMAQGGVEDVNNRKRESLGLPQMAPPQQQPSNLAYGAGSTGEWEQSAPQQQQGIASEPFHSFGGGEYGEQQQPGQPIKPSNLGNPQIASAANSSRTM